MVASRCLRGHPVREWFTPIAWRRYYFDRRCLQSKRFRHSSGQIIRSYRVVNLDGAQFQMLRFLVEAVGEHGIALEQVAEGSLRVACFPEKSPFRSPPGI